MVHINCQFSQQQCLIPLYCRTSFFLIGFFTLSLVCIVLIFKFGVIPAIHPPSNTVRGMFVLSSVVSGIAGGAISIFFWKGARYGIGAWGGFAFALWIQSFRNGGVIRPIGFRWILYIGNHVVSTFTRLFSSILFTYFASARLWCSWLYAGNHPKGKY
jgi:hypothetical protein